MVDNGEKLVTKSGECRICGDEIVWTIPKKVHNYFLSLARLTYVGPTVCKKKECLESDKLPAKVRLLWQTQEAAEMFEARII